MLMVNYEYLEAEVQRRLDSRTPPTAEQPRASEEAVEEGAANTRPDLGCNSLPEKTERSGTVNMPAILPMPGRTVAVIAA